MVKELISSKIKNIRTLNKLSQEEFAEKLEVSRQTVYYWEAGKAVPDYNKIVILCKEFDMSPNEFFSDDVCACTLDESCDCAIAESVEETDIVDNKKSLLKKILLAAFSLLVSIVFLSVGLKGIFAGFENAEGNLANLSVCSFNMSADNVLSLLLLVIAVVLAVLSSVLFARRGKNKK